MQVSLEDAVPRATVEELRRRGNDVVPIDGHHQFVSCQAIWRLPEGYLPASDPRRDGQVAGF
jgi:gamma-glutamyltranspeptidase / glutathione hydrolase